MGPGWLTKDATPLGGSAQLREHGLRRDAILAFVECHERSMLWLGTVAAIVLRAGWALVRPGSSSQGEAHNIAVAIASGRGFGDAFQVGQGATDHLMPTTPVLAGAVYSIFGINSQVAELILWAVATTLVVASYLIYYKAFARAGAPRWARMLAFWFLCLAPTYLQQESTDFRVWDGALAAFLSALFLDRLLALRECKPIRTADILIMSLLAAAAFFTKPPAGLGLYAAAGIFCLLHLRGRAFATALVAAPLALALFLVPWGLRNEAVMGKFILLRDNAGLELALSQYDGALAPIDGRERRLARYHQIHPMGDSYARFSAMGEVAYSQMLARETKVWMRGHPDQVGRIVLMHLGQVVTPPAWLFRLWGSGRLADLRALCGSIVGILGMLGLVCGLLTRRREWLYFAAFVIPALLSYLVFQPLPRYIYMFYAPFAFCATGLVLVWPRRRVSNPELIETAAVAAL
jgi:hypothetical protein